MIRRGVWLIAGTSLHAPYPCRCFEGRDRWACEHGRCPCWGRTDVMSGVAGPACCAWAWPGLAAALVARAVENQSSVV